MGKTSIEWTDESWNPTSGCSKVSEGCRNCFAERIANRFWGGRPFSEVRCHPERLKQPMHWRKPRRVFVDSMSDLFHDLIGTWFIQKVFETMRVSNHHVYQVLTKRPERMKKFLDYYCNRKVIAQLPQMRHMHFGVSCEDQAAVDESIPLLLRTPAAVRYVSLEPLLAPIVFSRLCAYCPTHDFHSGFCSSSCPDLRKLDWVIVGGESGPGARPMHPDWVRSIRDQCQSAGIPFFFKGWGEWLPSDHDPDYETGPGTIRYCSAGNGDPCCLGLWRRVGKKAAGRLLNGFEWNEFPDQLRTKSATNPQLKH